MAHPQIAEARIRQKRKQRFYGETKAPFPGYGIRVL